MSPPTRPALSAGEPGGSTFPKVSPPSVLSNPFTPTYDRGGAIAVVTMPGGRALRAGVNNAVKAPAATKNNSKPRKIQVMPLIFPPQAFTLPLGMVIGEFPRL